MKIVALLAVRNEELYLPTCLAHLVSQGVEVYLIDNESTDRTLEIAQSFVGRGVLGIESIPFGGAFDFPAILRRKEQLAQELEADWFMHCDADEIREAPHPFSNLAAGFAAVDALGFNAVNFDEFVFIPASDDENHERTGYVNSMRHYYYFRPRESYRLNAWKRSAAKVDLATFAGHQVRFDGIKPCPLSFVLRHYIVLSRRHAIAKYGTRRFSESSLRNGWHADRAKFRSESFVFPSRDRLKQLDNERGWDRSDPQTVHSFLVDAAVSNGARVGPITTGERDTSSATLPQTRRATVLPPEKKLIVVLGMHRSGTSTLARSFGALGVSLGDNLTDRYYPPSADNPRGFWEDRDVNEINIGILSRLGLEWDSPLWIRPDEFKSVDLQDLLERAEATIRGKMTQCDALAIKDPRLARLLPFWNEVFVRAAVTPVFAIAYRHPISVARSLEVRNGFPREKSYYLWLGHLLAAIQGTYGRPRVVVDYDAMLDSPTTQLERLAIGLGLPWPAVPEALSGFVSGFLDNKLRHARHQQRDIELDPEAPADIATVAGVLEQAALDKASLDGFFLRRRLARMVRRLDEMSPAMRCIEKLQRQVDSAVGRSEYLSERARVAAELAGLAAERDGARDQLRSIQEPKSFRFARSIAAMQSAIPRVGLFLMQARRPKLPRTAAANAERRMKTATKKMSGSADPASPNALRRLYRRLPLPRPVRFLLGNTYRRFLNFTGVVLSWFLTAPAFAAPSQKPAAQHRGKADYIVWGVIDWHFRHQRPQQLAQALTHTGRRVFYISANLANDVRGGFELEPLDASGRLFQVRLYARRRQSIYVGAPRADIVDQLRRGIGELLLWADSCETVSLVQHPFWCEIASVLPNSRLVYDCLDHHGGFDNNGEEILALEETLLRRADVTVVTSTWLEQEMEGKTDRRLLIRNACDFDHFAARPTSVYRTQKHEPVIGYYGAIAEWFDQGLVEAVAKRHPECRVVLIGADTVDAHRRLGRLDNVALLGEVPYAQLPHYLHGFDVCLLPFRVVPLTTATNPVKVYEYLAAGKPVVAVDLPEMAQFGGLVATAHDTASFVDAVSHALAGSADTAAAEKRRAFARRETWQHRVESLIAGVEIGDSAGRISVVVVTYNNLALTKDCLGSLALDPHEAGREIIVVDNASSDGTPEFLAQWVEAGSGRQIILNETNKGFAAANNQGLAVASGDYLALLNNDTFVTPGWGTVLAGHLRRDRRIGLIGPTTNNIGNEARIDIHYTDMHDMRRQATERTYRRLGHTLPLRTAAFFCVMMRREVYERVGPLDEAFGTGFFEDDDYCRRVEQLGLTIMCAEDVFVHHHLSASFNAMGVEAKQQLFERNKRVYESKWGPWVPHRYRERSDVGAKRAE